MPQTGLARSLTLEFSKPEPSLDWRNDEIESASADVQAYDQTAWRQALENLGHAVEYLIDAHLFDYDPESGPAHVEAVRILKRASRAVFAECDEALSMRRRIEVVPENLFLIGQPNG